MEIISITSPVFFDVDF